MNETIAYLPGVSPVENKELCAHFDGGRLSSDGGVLLLRGIDRRLGIAGLLASCLTDARELIPPRTGSSPGAALQTSAVADVSYHLHGARDTRD